MTDERLNFLLDRLVHERERMTYDQATELATEVTTLRASVSWLLKENGRLHDCLNGGPT
jgi:hypothetical protein